MLPDLISIFFAPVNIPAFCGISQSDCKAVDSYLLNYLLE
jgi:hypothetical protein